MHTVHLASIRRTFPITSTSTSRTSRSAQHAHSRHHAAEGVMVLDDMKATICVCAAPKAWSNGRRSRGRTWRGRARAHSQVKVEAKKSGGQARQCNRFRLSVSSSRAGSCQGHRAHDDEPMKVIVGLGNPGKEYERTRHTSAGWVVGHLPKFGVLTAGEKPARRASSNGMVGNTRCD